MPMLGFTRDRNCKHCHSLRCCCPLKMPVKRSLEKTGYQHLEKKKGKKGITHLYPKGETAFWADVTKYTKLSILASHLTGLNHNGTVQGNTVGLSTLVSKPSTSRAAHWPQTKWLTNSSILTIKLSWPPTMKMRENWNRNTCWLPAGNHPQPDPAPEQVSRTCLGHHSLGLDNAQPRTILAVYQHRQKNHPVHKNAPSHCLFTIPDTAQLDSKIN